MSEDKIPKNDFYDWIYSSFDVGYAIFLFISVTPDMIIKNGTNEIFGVKFYES